MDTHILQSLGLSEKAGKIYLTTLAIGTTTIQNIASKSGIKRPTAYSYIAELVAEGLLEKIPIGKKEYYRAADPNLLYNRAEQNLKGMKESMPQLLQLQGKTTGRPRMRILEGRKALTAVHAEIANANSIRFWADLTAFENLFPEAFDSLSSAIANSQIRTREILPDTLGARKSSQRYAAVAGKYYASRIAKTGPIYNDSAIYGNTLAFFRIHELNLFVVIIEDPTIAATMKTIFDLAWESAEPFIPKG